MSEEYKIEGNSVEQSEEEFNRKREERNRTREEGAKPCPHPAGMLIESRELVKTIFPKSKLEPEKLLMWQVLRDLQKPSCVYGYKHTAWDWNEFIFVSIDKYDTHSEKEPSEPEFGIFRARIEDDKITISYYVPDYHADMVMPCWEVSRYKQIDMLMLTENVSFPAIVRRVEFR
ncbi:MAG: hypothetical protein ABW007_19085 [Chitinophagaceae bacterium]